MGGWVGGWMDGGDGNDDPWYCCCCSWKSYDLAWLGVQ